jgi:hypothetical protein
MTITFDTSGAVTIIEEFAPGCDHVKRVEWSDLSPFAQGYVEAMARVRAAEIAEVRPLFAFSDLAPETLALILRDCESARLILGRRDSSTDAGKWLWITRNSNPHMTTSGFPPLTPYLGDDGKVYLRVAA